MKKRRIFAKERDMKNIIVLQKVELISKMIHQEQNTGPTNLNIWKQLLETTNNDSIIKVEKVKKYNSKQSEILDHAFKLLMTLSSILLTNTFFESFEQSRTVPRYLSLNDASQ